jgi:hypothetical protein
MNPARTLGPDIVAVNYTGWWVYIAGPLIGAAIAVAVIDLVRGLPDKEEREAAEAALCRSWSGPTSQAESTGGGTWPQPRAYRSSIMSCR